MRGTFFAFWIMFNLFNIRIGADNVDGNWSAWSKIVSPCNKNCGGGEIIERRSCTNPPPNGGSQCLRGNGTRGTTETRAKSCNVHPCFVESEENWSDWVECENCTVGIRYKENLCGGEVCTGNQYRNKTEDCNRWKLGCPDQCEKREEPCPEYSSCVDISTEAEPKTTCKCVMERVMSEDSKKCIVPPPPMPTPRPTPTLPPAQKKVANVVTKSASTVLIVFVSITLLLFILMRVFTTDRVIQMNMEIALLMAHVFLMFPSDTTQIPGLCKFVSIAIHYFFTAVYIFIALEAIHMYSFVAQVVKKDGFFTKVQNVIIGWGVSAIIVLMCICFEFDNYGGSYHCWLQVDTNLMFGHIVPAIFFSILAFTFIEAAGNSDNLQPLPGINQEELMSARISQRTNLVILPLVLSHWIIGIFSEYEQDLALYGVYSVLNGVLGACVFFFHCTNNAKVRKYVYGMCKKATGRRG